MCHKGSTLYRGTAKVCVTVPLKCVPFKVPLLWNLSRTKMFRYILHIHKHIPHVNFSSGLFYLKISYFPFLLRGSQKNKKVALHEAENFGLMHVAFPWNTNVSQSVTGVRAEVTCSQICYVSRSVHQNAAHWNTRSQKANSHKSAVSRQSAPHPAQNSTPNKRNTIAMCHSNNTNNHHVTSECLQHTSCWRPDKYLVAKSCCGVSPASPGNTTANDTSTLPV